LRTEPVSSVAVSDHETRETPKPSPDIEWRVSDPPVAYETAVAAMEERASAIGAGTAGELVWLLEHPPLYTAGTSANNAELISPRFPVHRSGRGGKLTYHGPGQRVAYLMLDLRRRGTDVRRYVAALEEWIIRTLARFDVAGERRPGRVGIWVARPDKGPRCEDKIAAIGVRIRRWITMHGIAINIDCDLSHFRGIVPCGISEPQYGVTSMAELGIRASARQLDEALAQEFGNVFGMAKLVARTAPDEASSSRR
jgi:lipoyl(octanoyl) transferase